MLQGRVIRSCVAALVAALVLGACGGGAIEDNVVRPGITAMEQASALACSNDAQALDQAIQMYTQLEGSAPHDQAALVATRYLREPSTLHHVVDGQIVPVDPGCGGTGVVATTPSGSPPMTAPSTDVGEIVTSTEVLTPQQMLAEFTPDEIAEVGGEECAGELASLFVAAQNYVSEQGKDPETIADLQAYLDQTIDLWLLETDTLVPAPDSGCVALDSTPADAAAACQAGTKTLQVARQAYFAQMGQGAEPTQQQLVDIGFLRELNPDLDLSGGTVVAVPGGACEGIDLGL